MQIMENTKSKFVLLLIENKSLKKIMPYNPFLNEQIY